MTGVVKWFSSKRGWGFICSDGPSDIFVHYSQISGEGFRTLRGGQLVGFELDGTKRGPTAADVRRVRRTMVTSTRKHQPAGDPFERALLSSCDSRSNQ